MLPISIWRCLLTVEEPEDSEIVGLVGVKEVKQRQSSGRAIILENKFLLFTKAGICWCMT